MSQDTASDFGAPHLSTPCVHGETQGGRANGCFSNPRSDAERAEPQTPGGEELRRGWEGVCRHNMGSRKHGRSCPLCLSGEDLAGNSNRGCQTMGVGQNQRWSHPATEVGTKREELQENTGWRQVRAQQGSGSSSMKMPSEPRSFTHEISSPQ